MKIELAGRCALVTGSTSGIGLGIAWALARAGANVALNGFGDTDTIRALQEQIRAECGVRVIYCPADVSGGDACRVLIRRVQEELGALDILVNNAGVQHVSPIESFPAERWDAVIATNLSSAFHLIAAALPAMRTVGYGRIVNIASAHGLVASRDKSAYVASKHGLIGLTRVVALEAAGQGITCNAICPGWVLTPLVSSQLEAWMERDHVDRPEAERRLLSEKQPSGQFTRPDQIGALTVFLCSEAAANMTGAALPVDGGWTAQ